MPQCTMAQHLVCPEKAELYGHLWLSYRHKELLPAAVLALLVFIAYNHGAGNKQSSLFNIFLKCHC